MKVHFAGFDSDLRVLYEEGVNYTLVSYYHINRTRPLASPHFKHMIIDSGLFTMMFGADKDKGLTYEQFEAYAWGYMAWMAQANPDWTFVELDIQKVFGVDAAWEWRERLRAENPGRSIINAYHIEDENPDRLIEFSDYIAISIPELRWALTRKDMENVMAYISRKATLKGKRVHLLGCTEQRYLKAYRNLYSCDSTSWSSSFRFGTGKHPDFGEFKVRQLEIEPNDDRPSIISRRVAIRMNLDLYTRYAGPQD